MVCRQYVLGVGMNQLTLTESLRQCCLHMVRETLRDMRKLNANNLSLTILALIAYGGERSQLVTYLCNQLLKKQLDRNGSWMDELWATGLALLAMHEYMKQQDRPFNYRAPYVRKALEYIDSTWDAARSNWQGEFLESILLSYVLLRIEHQKSYGSVIACLERLKKLQNEGGFFDIYDTSLAMCAFHAGQMSVGMDTSAVVAAGLKWLKHWDFSKESIWSRGVTLFMLCQIDSSDEAWSSAIAGSLAEVIQEGVVSDDHDEQAITILALSSFLSKWNPYEFKQQRVTIESLLKSASRDSDLRRRQKRLNVILRAIKSADIPLDLIKSETAGVGMKDKLNEMQAQAIALGHSLEDLKRRRNAGYIDNGRYANLSTELDRRRIQILLEIKDVLGGKDRQMDEIIRDAIRGENEYILMDRLAKVAHEKGLGEVLIEELREHKGFIVSWLIEIGIQLAKRVGTP
jgi:hypothetical protein